MLTGVFKDRSRVRGNEAQSPDDALALLLLAKSLRPHRFTRQCEIGPFVVAHVCAEQALVIELSRNPGVAEPRHVFLESLGYTILTILPRDLARPDVVISQVLSALK